MKNLGLLLLPLFVVATMAQQQYQHEEETERKLRNFPLPARGSGVRRVPSLPRRSGRAFFSGSMGMMGSMGMGMSMSRRGFAKKGGGFKLGRVPLLFGKPPRPIKPFRQVIFPPPTPAPTPAPTPDPNLEVIAQVPLPGICFERIPGEGQSSICTPEETAAQGGGACNVVSQAFLERTPTADVSIQNSGGCQSDINPGPFTVGDANTLLPFENSLITFEMTGQQIRNVLEQALQFALVVGCTGAYPYAHGLRYDVDGPALTVNNIEVNPRLAGEWMPIGMDQVYTVVANSFIAAGGDGYVEFEEPGVAATQQDQAVEYAQTFIDWVRSLPDGIINDLPLDQYSTQSYIFRPLPAAALEDEEP